MIMAIDIKTIVLHYKKLTERKESVIRQLDSIGFTNYSFYEDYDSNELTDSDIEVHYVISDKDPDTWTKKVSLWGPGGLQHKKFCNPAEISLTIKFGKVFELLSSLNDEYFILLEDDIFLCDNFEEKFNRYMENTPPDWDAIYFGSGANLHPNDIKEGKVAYLKKHPASRCADSIIIKNNTVCDLAKTWFPFNLVSDWEIGYQHYLHDHQVYWWEPSLVIQGSENGIFKSTLR